MKMLVEVVGSTGERGGEKIPHMSLPFFVHSGHALQKYSVSGTSDVFGCKKAEATTAHSTSKH